MWTTWYACTFSNLKMAKETHVQDMKECFDNSDERDAYVNSYSDQQFHNKLSHKDII